MPQHDCIKEIHLAVNDIFQSYLQTQPIENMASVNWIQELAQECSKEISLSIFKLWREKLERMAQELKPCPKCGQPRKFKWRLKEPIRIDVLGFAFELPKPYLECAHCDAPGLSVLKLLTGLSGGDASLELELMTGYCSSQHSYKKASRDLKVHYDQQMERTKVRRLALKTEAEALEYAEQTRQAALRQASQETKRQGPAVLLEEADGGKVRTGKMQPCEPGDAGYGKKSPKRGLPRRKRPINFREIITMDVRQPGEVEATALDAMVPVLSPEGERSRRMLALAVRKGLGDNTFIQGLGDMGSGLATAFEEAFVGYRRHWSADWKHTRDYVEAASAVLEGIDRTDWSKRMRAAIWAKDEGRREELLLEAERQRVKNLPKGVAQCPVKTLRTYLKNNWKNMDFARLEEEGLPIVSARAESQVRDLTKDRFCMAGAWREENLEPKAVLRTIIAEGRFEDFKRYVIEKYESIFKRRLMERLKNAVAEGRLSQEQLARVVGQEPQRVAA